jgi:hypothetical protein
MSQSTENYYYTYNEIINSDTQINYSQLIDNNYSSLNYNANIKLQDNKGFLYGNKNVQKNIIDKNINGTNLLTLKTENGILMFLNAPDSFYFPTDSKTISKPVYTSGYYLGKNIEIIVEILKDTQQTRKISVVFL